MRDLSTVKIDDAYYSGLFNINNQIYGCDRKGNIFEITEDGIHIVFDINKGLKN